MYYIEGFFFIYYVLYLEVYKAFIGIHLCDTCSGYHSCSCP